MSEFIGENIINTIYLSFSPRNRPGRQSQQACLQLVPADQQDG